MRIIYILLICLVIYYITVQYFEKYITQENFDSSLVPVSSIVTFAKIAQKLVNGGTLLIPSHLQIGNIDGSETGDLNVTGDAIFGNGSGTVLSTVGSKENNGNLTIEGKLLNNNSNMNLSFAAIAGDAFINNLTVSDKTMITGNAIINNSVSGANIQVNGAAITNDMTNDGDLSVVNPSAIGTARVSGNIKDSSNVIFNKDTNQNYIKNDSGSLKIGSVITSMVTDPIDWNASRGNGPLCNINGKTYSTMTQQPYFINVSTPQCVAGTPHAETYASNIKLYDDVVITGDLTVTGTQNVIPSGMMMFWADPAEVPSGWTVIKPPQNNSIIAGVDTSNSSYNVAYGNNATVVGWDYDSFCSTLWTFNYICRGDFNTDSFNLILLRKD